MAAATLGTDSVLARRIARAIVDFLDSVEPAPDVDLEGLAVAKDCIEHVFKLKSSASDVEVPSGLLVDLFSSFEAGQQCNSKPPLIPWEIRNTSSSTSTYRDSEVKEAKESNAYSVDQVGDADSSEKNIKDELLGKFFSSLDRVNFFSVSHDGVEDMHSLERATNFFHDAYADLENAGKEINLSNLAEAFKSKGNECLRTGLFLQAIDLYTCAIAVCERNAVYYCNRAAAYTKIQKYSEAIEDCLKSIQFDPSYSKAYNCLGVAYDRQGKLAEALTVFYRALELDPSNETVKENIRVTEQKLRESNLRAEGDGMNTGSGRQSARSFARETNNAFPIFPQEIMNIFENMASTAAGGNQAHESTSAGSSEERTEPGIRLGPGINLGHHVSVDIGQMPNQISEILRAMTGSHTSSQEPPGGTTRGGDERT